MMIDSWDRVTPHPRVDADVPSDSETFPHAQGPILYNLYIQ